MTEQNHVLHERLEWLGANHDNASGKSDKFYEVTVDHNDLYFTETRRWGRFGAKGQTKVLQHYGEYSALESARKILAKKRDKGYTKPVAPLTRLASVLDDEE